jgi:hypothetical protein
MYHNQTDGSENGQENASTFAQRKSVDLYEGLGSSQSEEGVQVWSAEQEEDCDEESHASGEPCRDQYSPSGGDAAV